MIRPHDLTVSRTLAKEMFDAGYPQEHHENLFSWYEIADIPENEQLKGEDRFYISTEKEEAWGIFARSKQVYIAPISDEILQKLPENVVLKGKKGVFNINITFFNDLGEIWWYVNYANIDGEMAMENQYPTLAEAAGRCWLYLKAYKII